MATGSSNPTVRRRELARRLRELRTEAGFSVDDVAKELMCSAAKVSRMETGERGVQLRDIRDLCRFYGVSEAEQSHLMKLAQEAAKRGWWQEFRSLDQQVANFVAFESAAVEIRLSHSMIVPGLLQTPDYTRALVTRLRPPGEFSDADVDDAVRLREVRQSRLKAGELRYRTVVDEAVFRRQVGSAAIMQDQVERLIDFSVLPHVAVQVIPFEAGPHPSLEGSFQIVDLGPGFDDLVFVEGLVGYFLIDDAGPVQRYSDIFEYLSNDVALSEAESAAWLRDVLSGWRQMEAGPA